MSCCAGPIVADCASDMVVPSRRSLVEELKASSRGLPGGGVNFIMSVPGIHCGNCVAAIEKSLLSRPGVRAVRANLSLRQVSVTLNSAAVVIDPVVEHLCALGYPPQPLLDEIANVTDPEFKSLLRALAVAGFAAANIMLLSVSVWNGADGATRDLFHLVSALIAIPAVAYAGMPFFKSAASAFGRRQMNMDVPISLGVVLATGMSMYEILLGHGHAYFDAAVSLLFFLLAGRTLDHMMRGKARLAAERLLRLSAKGGFVLGSDGEISYVPLEALRPGMVVRVAAGERFPVDGVITEGASDVDRSLVTGESQPAMIGEGMSVEAGTLNLTGAVDMRASRAANDSFLAEIMRMMAAAEQGRGSYARLADRMARLYSPAVHVAAFAAFVGWMIWTRGDFHTSLTVAIAVLIITCPCALGLAVPVAHVVSAGRLFDAGILMKDGSALERLETISAAYFDKTGTLTTGEPDLLSTCIPAGRLANVARALAQRSMHPAARALARFLRDATSANVTDVREIPGMGVEGSVGKAMYRLGRIEWVSEIANGVQVGEGTLAFGATGTPVYLSSLSEKLREGALETVTGLKDRGISCSILSGDRTFAVRHVAQLLDIRNFSANLLPGGKVEALQRAASQSLRVLMVGDGLNDAPALAAAHVSMAPSSASDLGRTVADFVFTRGGLQAVTFALAVARRTGRIVRQNFALAVIYNVLAVPLAVAGQLNPLIAAVAMSTSSIIVVANSLRLYRVSPVGPDATAETSQTLPAQTVAA